MADVTTVPTFATVDDLEFRSGKRYEDGFAGMVETLLEDASYLLVGLGFDPDESNPVRLHLAKQCVCNAVANKLSRDAAFETTSQMSESVGPYSKTVTFVTPSGSLSFFRKDLALLGLGTQEYRSVQAGCADLGGCDAHNW